MIFLPFKTYRKLSWESQCQLVILLEGQYQRLTLQMERRLRDMRAGVLEGVIWCWAMERKKGPAQERNYSGESWTILEEESQEMNQVWVRQAQRWFGRGGVRGRAMWVNFEGFDKLILRSPLQTRILQEFRRQCLVFLLLLILLLLAIPNITPHAFPLPKYTPLTFSTSQIFQ